MTTLQDHAVGGAAPLMLPLIGGDKPLACEMQQRLGEIGLLDPPVDGSFGPVSHWALRQFLQRAGLAAKKQLDREVAETLLSAAALQRFAIKPGPGTLAGRIVAAMLARRHWLCRHPDAVNIVYVEGMDEDGAPNTDAPNAFNDLRLLLRIGASGRPQIVGSWEATTEPGAYYTKVKPLDARGAARIAFGQYKAWSVGMHPAHSASSHEALVQTADITVFRDLNRDFQRSGDATFTGMFGVNQHWGYDLPRQDIGKASAGCLVGRTKKGHREFMAACKADPRYGANHSYRFMATVLPASAVMA